MTKNLTSALRETEAALRDEQDPVAYTALATRLGPIAGVNVSAIQASRAISRPSLCFNLSPLAPMAHSPSSSARNAING